MPEIPAGAVRAAVDALMRHDASVGGYGLFEGEQAGAVVVAEVVLKAALPHLSPKRKPRIVCPVCTQEVVRRDDDTPSAHDVPLQKRDLMCERTFGRCRGGCRHQRCCA